MPIDRIEHMTIENLPPVTEEQSQFCLLRQLAEHPDKYRLVIFQLPADLRIHARYALIHKWENQYDIQSISIHEFSEKLIAAIYDGTWFSSMKYLEEPSILLVDDLNLLVGRDTVQEIFNSTVIKPRLEKKRLTVLFSEKGYTELSFLLRDDLRNLLRLGLHVLD